MIRLSIFLMCGAFLASLLSGCNVSFQSNQFNFVKGMFSQKASRPEKNWEVHWQGRTYPVFAVNHDGGILFTDEQGLLVAFDGWQITQVWSSHVKNEKIAVIEKTTADDGTILLGYEDGNKNQLALDSCQAWDRIPDIGWEQACTSATRAGASGAGYTNTIDLNANGELIALRFMILPSTDFMQISLQQQTSPAGND